MDALGFDHAAFSFELGHPLVELGDDGIDGLRFAFWLDDVMALGVDGEAGVFLFHAAEERVDLGERFDFVAEEFYSIR
jgi:hypothetical protein